MILLDRKTKSVQQQIRKLIRGNPRFVLGIAIEEVEAWWLGDRINTFEWTDLTADELPPECLYGQPKYKAENDKMPKTTLDHLTRLSQRFDRYYGEGNLDMAMEFAEEHWARSASLDQISSQCPRGFDRFQRSMINAFRRARASAGRLF